MTFSSWRDTSSSRCCCSMLRSRWKVCCQHWLLRRVKSCGKAVSERYQIPLGIQDMWDVLPGICVAFFSMKDVDFTNRNGIMGVLPSTNCLDGPCLLDVFGRWGNLLIRKEQLLCSKVEPTLGFCAVALAHIGTAILCHSPTLSRTSTQNPPGLLAHALIAAL